MQRPTRQPFLYSSPRESEISHTAWHLKMNVRYSRQNDILWCPLRESRKNTNCIERLGILRGSSVRAGMTRLSTAAGWPCSREAVALSRGAVVFPFPWPTVSSSRRGTIRHPKSTVQTEPVNVRSKQLHVETLIATPVSVCNFLILLV
jgi:hypothetical protein